MPVSASYQYHHHTSTSVIPVPPSYQYQHHTSTTIIPVPASYQYHHHANTRIMPVLASYQYHHHTSTSIIPVPPSCQYQDNASTSVIPVPASYQYQDNASTSVIPVPPSCQHQPTCLHCMKILRISHMQCQISYFPLARQPCQAARSDSPDEGTLWNMSNVSALKDIISDLPKSMFTIARFYEIFICTHVTFPWISINT